MSFTAFNHNQPPVKTLIIMQTSTTLVSFASAALFLIVSCLAENLQQPPAGALLVQQSPGGDASSGDNEKRSSWNNLHTSWGKRYPIDDIIAARVLSNARDGLNDIDREALNDLLVNELLEASRLDEELDELYRPVAAAAEKRAWKNMNGAWGKRVSGGDWNKFRGKSKD